MSIRKHVIADLRPYVCIFNDCPTNELCFESEAERLEHEYWSHNLHWTCDNFNHAPESFSDAASFKDHMRLVHPEVPKQISLD